MAVLVRRKLEAVVPRSVHEVAFEAEDQLSWSAREWPGRGRTSRPHGSCCIAGRNQRGQLWASIDGGSGRGSYFWARHCSSLSQFSPCCAWSETGQGDRQSAGEGLDFNDVDAVHAGAAWNRDAVPSLHPLQRPSVRPGHHQLLVAAAESGASDYEGFRSEGLTHADAPVLVGRTKQVETLAGRCVGGNRWSIADVDVGPCGRYSAAHQGGAGRLTTTMRGSIAVAMRRYGPCETPTLGSAGPGGGCHEAAAADALASILADVGAAEPDLAHVAAAPAVASADTSSAVVPAPGIRALISRTGDCTHTVWKCPSLKSYKIARWVPFRQQEEVVAGIAAAWAKQNDVTGMLCLREMRWALQQGLFAESEMVHALRKSSGEQSV